MDTFLITKCLIEEEGKEGSWVMSEAGINKARALGGKIVVVKAQTFVLGTFSDLKQLDRLPEKAILHLLNNTSFVLEQHNECTDFLRSARETSYQPVEIYKEVIKRLNKDFGSPK